MKKILPPFLFIIFALGMGVVCWALDMTHYLGYPFNLIGLPLFIFGLYIVQSSKNLFKRESTNVFTYDKPDKLITNGFFKYSRNPMYLGFVVALFGVALLYQASLSSLILAVIYAIIVDRWYIAFEERMMQETFGESYTQYAAKTRRWI